MGACIGVGMRVDGQSQSSSEQIRIKTAECCGHPEGICDQFVVEVDPHLTHQPTAGDVGQLMFQPPGLRERNPLVSERLIGNGVC